MDNSDVLNNTEVNVPQSDPVPHDVDPDETPIVIEQDTGTMYKNAKGPTITQPIGENNHAETLANNALSNAEAQKTYDYTSQGKKNFDESVTTTTVQSTGANMTATWDSEMKMDKAYAAQEGEDYSWNKLATEMANLDYQQEAGQARYESMQSKQELDKAATTAFNNYFAAEYSARQTQDKMGWTGGQQQASDLQVAFLQAESAGNMYTQDEMQRYGVETKLGIARMYADANQRALALQYYQDAVDQSIKEAEQTGWYIPAEASEMFKQQEVANKILADPNSSPEARARAEQVNRNCQAYYDNKGFQRGYAYDSNGKVVTEYYGIKCLQMLTYEETVRNNKVNEELQRQANDIAQQGVNAAWAGVRAQEIGNALTKSLQNQIASTTIAADLQSGTAKKVTSKSSTNYYIDKNGNAQDIASSSPMVKDNGNYYVWVPNADATGGGNYHMVYNSDENYATSHANKAGTNNNYRPR